MVCELKPVIPGTCTDPSRRLLFYSWLCQVRIESLQQTLQQSQPQSRRVRCRGLAYTANSSHVRLLSPARRIFGVEEGSGVELQGNFAEEATQAGSHLPSRLAFQESKPRQVDAQLGIRYAALRCMLSLGIRKEESTLVTNSPKVGGAPCQHCKWFQGGRRSSAVESLLRTPLVHDSPASTPSLTRPKSQKVAIASQQKQCLK